MSALLFQPLHDSASVPAGLVELVREVKSMRPDERRWVVRYTDPWMGGHMIVAYGHELQVTS